MNDGVWIFVVNGFPRHSSPAMQKIAVGVWVFSLASTFTVSPIEFVFRYFLVVKYALV